MSTKKQPTKLSQRDAVRLFKRTMTTLSEQGFNVVAVLSRYQGKDAHFSAALSLHGDEAQQDHALLDAQREISVLWNNSRHEDQLVWKQAPKPDPKPEKPQAPPARKKPRAKKP